MKVKNYEEWLQAVNAEHRKLSEMSYYLNDKGVERMRAFGTLGNLADFCATPQELVAWIDVLAGVVARRHAGRNVTTACIDNLRFRKAAHINDIVVLRGRVTHTGRTSMEIRVDTYVEDINGLREQINTAYLVMVALDENDRPVSVPPLMIETEEEKIAWEAAERRQELRKQRRIEQF